ncbi:MAG: hypothetical protein IT320_01870 [Anaerolineae bacterium]|nr:hypothetical protein [Anaerolineae bacterium]
MRSTTLLRRGDLAIGLVAAGLALLYIWAAGGGFPLDDSWIHQTYGRNLAQYGEWAFTTGTPSTASTSPLYTVMLAIGYRLGVATGLWTHGLGILCLIVTGIIGSRMATRLLPDQRNIGLYTGLALVAEWHLIWAADAGMETMVFSMLTLVLIGWTWRELDPPQDGRRSFIVRGAVFGVMAGLATLARPEGAMLAGMIGLALLIARPHMTWANVITWGAAAVVAFGVVLAPYVSFNLQLMGGLLPNTAASKRADLVLLFDVPYLARVVNMILPLTASGLLLLIPGVAVFVAEQWRRLRTDRKFLLYGLPLAWSIGLVLLYSAYLPAYFQHGRYVIPAVPAFVVTGVTGTAMLVHQVRRSRVGRVLSRALVLATVAVFAVMALGLGLSAYQKDVSIIDNEMVRAAHWIADNLPENELLAIHDIGAVGFYAPRPIIDLAGLVSPELLPIIPIELHGEATWSLLRERDARYVMGFADQLPAANPDDLRLCPIFRSRGMDAEVSDTYNMSIYRIVWDEVCPTRQG